MGKIYVLDTNVLLHNPGALFGFEKNDIVLPFAVIEEIDNQKKRQDEIGRNARLVNRYLDGLRSKGNLGKGVQLDNGGSIRIEVNNISHKEVPKLFDLYKADNRILAVAMNLKKKKEGKEVILVSKDLNVRIKADTYEIKTEDYEKDKVDFDELYTGYSTLNLTEEDIEEIRSSGFVALREGIEAFPNQFFVSLNNENPLVVRYKKNETGGVLVPLKYGSNDNWGISALNLEQEMAQELLLEDEIPIVTLVGRAGTGKTLLSLAAGMELVVNEKSTKKSPQRRYDKLIVARPIIPMGKDIGYLPGSKEEKIDPWMQPIYDNLHFLMRDCDEPDNDIADLTRRGLLQIEILTFIRGRSIPKQFIICDEAQNLSPQEIKTLVTRAGKGTKIVLTGDPEQIDTPFLDSSSNGLSYFVEKMKGEKITGHVTLDESERSEVAEICSRRL